METHSGLRRAGDVIARLQETITNDRTRIVIEDTHGRRFSIKAIYRMPSDNVVISAKERRS